MARSKDVNGFAYSDYVGADPTAQQQTDFESRLGQGWNPWNAATGTPMGEAKSAGSGAPAPPSAPTNGGASYSLPAYQPYSPPDNSQQTALMKQMFDAQQAKDAQNQVRNNALYEQLRQRAGQATNIDPNDPVIKGQVDAYSAQQERSRRTYLNELAEKSGPLANLQGEQRLSAEKLGQNVGGMQANLISQELQSKRNEIAQALSSMGNLLSADQVNQLQAQLGIIDANIRQQGLGLQQYGLQNQQQLGIGDLMLRNMLGGMQNNQFYDKLGFDVGDRRSYWDAINNGTLKG